MDGWAGRQVAARTGCFCWRKNRFGYRNLLDLLDFDDRVKKADLVVVGEGQMDRQSLAGKAPVGVDEHLKTSCTGDLRKSGR